ncbi:hypothetical protein [uncultured Alistipes sp.]|nr:hypothetical protein [uncultured Alistipes sp.]
MQNTTTAPKVDTVLLSETVDGNYRVRRYRVERKGDADYSVLYRINVSTLAPKMGKNSEELEALNRFAQSLVQDTSKQVSRIIVTGYSSPDGPRALNDRLAKARMQNFLNYVNGKYDFSKRFDVKSNWVAEDWEGCRMAVEHAPVPDKQQVLAIINGNDTPDQKEYRLKQMPAAWEYMKVHILPPLRRAEVEVQYGSGTVFEQRIMIERPRCEPVEQSCQTPCDPCDLIVDENITGIIVEMPEE